MKTEDIVVEKIPGGWEATIGPLVVHGQTREEAIERLEAVLRRVGRITRGGGEQHEHEGR